MPDQLPVVCCGQPAREHRRAEFDSVTFTCTGGCGRNLSAKGERLQRLLPWLTAAVLAQGGTEMPLLVLEIGYLRGDEPRG